MRFEQIHPIRIVLKSAVIGLISMICTGCWVTVRNLEQSDSAKGVDFFNAYRLKISGVGATAHGRLNIECRIAFLNDITDTSVVDTIPIFVIDSIYFSGECLSETLCFRPMSYYEANVIASGQGGKLYTDPFCAPDIWYSEGKLSPGGFWLNGVVGFPEACNGTYVEAIIKASLHDRTTGSTILQESKKILSRISKQTRMDIGS